MHYKDFVRESMPGVSHLPPKERMREIGRMWQKQKQYGSGMSGGSVQRIGKSRLGGAKKRVIAVEQQGAGDFDLGSTGSVAGDLVKGISMPFKAAAKAAPFLKVLLPFIF
jgi:hypothetical protein